MDNTQELLELERLEYAASVEKGSAELQRRIREIKASHSARGILLSGATIRAITDARVALCETLIDCRLDARRKYGATNRALLSGERLNQLKTECLNTVESFATALNSIAADVPGLSNIPGHSETYTSPLRTKVEREIRRLEIEGKVGMIDTAKGTTVLNISNSVVTGLNVGAVVGDMSTTVNHLQHQGNADVANAFKVLIEAFAGDEQLGNSRRDVLEHLVVIGDEADKPPEKRRLGVVRSSFEHIRSLITVASQANQLWTEWGPQLLKYFGLS